MFWGEGSAFWRGGLLSALLLARGGIHVHKRDVISDETLISVDNTARHVFNHIVVLAILVKAACQPGGRLVMRYDTMAMMCTLIIYWRWHFNGPVG